MSEIVTKSLDALGKGDIRRRNALETLYALLAGVLHHRFSNWSSDVAIIFAGKEKGAIEAQFLRLIKTLGDMLFVDSEEIRRLSINTLITLLTANNSLEDNFIVKYFIEARLEEQLLQLTLTQPSGITRRDLLSIITLLAVSSDVFHIGSSQRNGNKSLNSYSEMLRTCEDGPFLQHTVALLEHDMRVALRHRGGTPYEESSGATSNASFFANWFRIGSASSTQLIDDEELKRAQSSPSECFLSHPGLTFLIIHFLTQYNEFFVKCLFFPTTLSANTTKKSKALPSAIVPPLLCDLFEVASFFLPSVEPKGYVYSRMILSTFLVIVENTEISFRLHDARAKLSFVGEKRKAPRPPIFDAPLPLAAHIIDLCHIFLRNHLSLDSFIGGELPWICELYSTCLQVLHRLFCFQKKVHMRLSYPWKTLWSTLMTFLLSFCAAILARSAVEISVLENFVLPVIHHVLTLFNIGITFGDSFLPSPTDYDELYYEIIRCEREFKIIISSIEEIVAKVQEAHMPKSPTESDEDLATSGGSNGDGGQNGHGERKEAQSGGDLNENENGVNGSGKSSPEPTTPEYDDLTTPRSRPITVTVMSDLFNLRSILDHFSEKIGHFLIANPDTPLTGPLVINMIKSNYENLRLRLQDDIDQFEKYDSSSTSERKMIRRYAKVLVQDLKLKRYTEIESAITHPVSSKLDVHPSPQ